MATQLLEARPRYAGLSFEEYLRTPLIEGRYDIIDGDLFMSPSPVTGHQLYSKRIAIPLSQFVEDRDLGVVLYAPCDLLIRRAPLRVRQPDVLYLSSARCGIMDEDELLDVQPLELVPDIAIEILSAREYQRRLPGKFDDYAMIGVPELWLVAPTSETIEVLSLERGAYARTAIYRAGDIVTSKLLPGFELEVDAVFRSRKRRAKL